MADFPMVLESFVLPTAGIGDDFPGTKLELFVSPFPLGFSVCREIGYYAYWINKVWDSAGPAWVLWESELEPDVTGKSFPDPYQSGFLAVIGSYRAWPIQYTHGNDLDDPMYPGD